MNTKNIYLRLPEEMEQKLANMAMQRGIPRAAVIKNILYTGLKDEKPD